MAQMKAAGDFRSVNAAYKAKRLRRAEAGLKAEPFAVSQRRT